MSIVVECPHCDSRYNLQPDLIGKAMRCPNPDCREIFTVQPIAAAPPAPPPPPEPVPTASAPFLVLEGEAAPPAKAVPPADTAPYLPAVTAEPDLVPILEDEPATAPYARVEAEPLVPILEGEAAAPPPAAKPTRPQPRVVEAEVVADEPLVAAVVEDEPLPAAVVADAPPGPKVRDWKRAAPPPAAAAEKPEPERVARKDDESSFGELVLPNRRGPGVWKWVLVGLVVVGVGLGVYIPVQSYINEGKREENLAKQATEEFQKQNYPEALKLYDQLQAEFPGSKDTDKYQFFGKLSDVHTTISAVTARDNPAEGQKKFEGFLAEYKDSPLSKPTDTGYGVDVFDAGRKLVDNFAENADQSLKTFAAGRRQKRELLDAAERSAADGRALLPTVERYRIKEIKPLDDRKARFDELTARVARERERLAVIDPFRDLTKDPTDQRIAQFVVALKQARFDTDEEALQLIADAKAELRRLIRGVQEFRAPVAAPPDPAGGLLFVSSPLGQSTLPVIAPADAPPDTFFATVRGVLYAFDPDSGNLLWATRVGRSVTDLPARFPERSGLPAMVLVPVDRNGFGLTAFVARTGVPKWHQPLEGPVAGQPIVVNNRIYVPLKDDLGTVVEIEGATGNRLSHIHLRQRIGPGAVRQPGTGMIFVAAEARRVFAINTEPFDAEGNRLPVQCVQVLATDHPELSLRVAPIISGPVGDTKANRYLILAQADGTQATKLRGFPITPPAPVDPAVGPPEIAPPLSGAVGLPGHVLFPPHSDGERVAVVTDAGSFALFGTNQPGNQDPNIYAVPSAGLPVDAKAPVAGQVISGEEDTFWAVSRGKLYRLRLALTPGAGLQVMTSGLPQAVGVPVQAAQLNLRRDTALIVVRSEDSDGVRAVTFDPRDGRPKWQRKVGVASVGRPIPQGPAGSLVVDEDAGVFLLPPAAVDEAGRQAVAVPTAALLPPVAVALAPAQACATPDGRTVWALVAERGEKDSMRLRVRRVVEGKPQGDELVQLPERLAGPPVATGDGVAFPCGDGFLYRFQPGGAKLLQGPMWRGEAVPPGEPCFVAAVGADEFLATDGNKQVTRFRWAGGADWKAVAGPWVLREKISFAPTIVPLSANELRLFVADVTGNVWMYDANQAGEPLTRWRAAKDDADNLIPPGRPTTGFVVGRGPAGVVIAYAVENRHVVAISPGNPKAVWAVRRLGAAETLGAVTSGTAFLFTDIAGVVTAYDQTTGEKLGAIRSENQDLIPRTPAQPVGDGKQLLMPTIDGSVVTLPNPGV